MLTQILINGKDMNLSEFPEVEERLIFLSPEELQEIKQIVSNIQAEHLYQGNFTHGLYHSEKTFIYTYLLAKKEGIKEPFRQILFDAAIYHDCNRQDNFEDSIHGYASANKIKGLLDSKEISLSSIYNNKKYQVILYALMETHSARENADSDLNCLLNQASNLNLLKDELTLAEELIDIVGPYLTLCKILKDADALDRKRFGDVSYASLNEEYLRLESSKKLVDFADQINKLYFELMKQDYEEIDETKVASKNCIHSIGFDFFKINSVLEHGVLSADEMKKRKLNIPRNFTGGNFDRWISVVDLDLIKENLTAKKEFIDKGISFTCHDVKLHEPMGHNQRLQAFEKGRPWNKSEHLDERYALMRIAPEKIISINIPNSYADTSLNDLNYLYNSLDIDMIINRVNYYMRQTQTPKDDLLAEEVNIYIGQYNLELKKYLFLDNEERKSYDLVSKLNPILAQISSVIGKMVTRFYANRISIGNKDKITVLDAVNYELSLNTKYCIDTTLLVDDKITMTLSRDTNRAVNKEKIIN